MTDALIAAQRRLEAAQRAAERDIQSAADVYEHTEAGKLLRKVRQVVAEHCGIDHAPAQVWGKTPTEIPLRDWSATLSTATALERKALLQLAAAGCVAIKP